MPSENIYFQMENIIDLSSSERHVINYLLENGKQAFNYSIVELGTKTFTSASTITRVYRRLGFESYGDFKTALIRDLNTYTTSQIILEKKEIISAKDDVETIIKKITNNSINALLKVTHLNNLTTFQSVVDYMKSANQIHLFGSGVSNLICRDAMQKGLRSGCNITSHIHYVEMMMQARLANPNDLAIIVSYTGESDDMIKVAKILKINHIKTVSITSNTNNSIVKLSQVKLFVDASESFYRVGGMDSRMSMQHVLDIIFSIYFSQVAAARASIEKSLLTEDFTKK